MSIPLVRMNGAERETGGVAVEVLGAVRSSRSAPRASIPPALPSWVMSWPGATRRP